MPNRLTAAELGITPEEYEDLIWVRDALDPEVKDVKLPAWLKFDIKVWSSLDVYGEYRHGCRTAACIGGSMALHRIGATKDPKLSCTREIYSRVDRYQRLHSPALHGLFFRFPGIRMTQRIVVEAIDHFLSGRVRDPWRWVGER